MATIACVLVVVHWVVWFRLFCVGGLSWMTALTVTGKHESATFMNTFPQNFLTFYSAVVHD
jgi:hypothetical protein